jgi:dipeptidyl aminopeptidase/acylaminoacyl peptidase
MNPSTPRPLGALSSILCLWLLWQSPAACANDLAERFATAPSIWTATVSLDGKHVALGCMRRDVPAVCVYELDSTTKPAIVLHAPPEHMLRHFFWLDHGWMLMRVQMPQYDRGLHRWVGRYNDIATHISTQKSISLGSVEELVAIPTEPPSVVFGTGAELVRVNLASGEMKRERHDYSLMRPTLYAWHNDRGEQVLAVRSDKDLEKLFVLRGMTGAEVPLDAAMTKEYPYDPMFLGFTDGGDKLATLGYFGGDDLQLQLFDSATGKRVPRDPALQGLRFEAGISDVDSEELVGLYYWDDVPRQKFLDATLERVHATVTKALPGANIEIVSWSRDRSLASVRATSPGKPPAFYLFDRKLGTLSPLGSADLADLPPTRTTAIEYTARDGLKIEALLTVPANPQNEQSPLPLVVMPHSGPYQRDYAGYSWWAEYLTQRGYAVLRPNYRGSSGYGRAFFEKGHGEFGGAIIDDIIDGARFVVASGRVDRDRVCAVGIGYGGYAALMAGLREPSLVKCIVAVNTISDAVTVLGNTQRFYSTRSPAFQFWEKYIGGRYHDPAAAAAISPARSAAKIRPPVLLLHDTRSNGSPVTQSRHLKEQMDLYQRDAKLIEFDTGDQDLVTAKSRRVVLTESDAFLAKYLNGK